MKVTNADVWQARPACHALCKELWPIKTAYGLAKLGRKLDEVHRDIDAVRLDLIKRYGKTNGENQITVQPGSDGWEAFATAWNELMAVDVEINWGPVVLPDTDVPVAPDTLMAMGPFIEFVETEGKG